MWTMSICIGLVLGEPSVGEGSGFERAFAVQLYDGELELGFVVNLAGFSFCCCCKVCMPTGAARFFSYHRLYRLHKV